MIAASAGESLIVVSCMQQHGSLLVSSGNRGHLSCTVTDRSAETLLSIVKAFMVPSSTIVSGCWGYNVRLQ